ncbi:MAG: hypothetical protein IJZ89_02845 [Clostridia bacterium]|nr:hypothetical protein [Clostridia bacterium]
MFWRDLLTGIEFTVIVGVLAHIAGLIIPPYSLNHESFPFRAFEWERNGSIYRKLHISSWISHLPDMSKIIPYMFRKKLDREMSAEHIMRYIKETCLAELIHFMLILASPILAIAVDGKTGMAFMLIYALCNLPFIFIQRYNRPKLERLYARQIKKEESSGKGIEDCEGVDSVM